MGLLRMALSEAGPQAAQPSTHGSLGADFSRRSPQLRSGKEGLCAAVPIAAEIQAILKGSRHLAAEPADSKSCIFGCSPPPRDCTNALVRDSSFSSMRGARPMQGASAGSCSTFYHSDGGDGYPLSCISPAASAYSTA